MDRRDFLKTVAVAGLATQLTGEASAADHSRATPHLGRVLQPSPVTGARQSVAAPEPRTVATAGSGGTTSTRSSAAAPVQAQLPATGFPEPAGYVGIAAVVAAAFLTRERRDPT